MDLETILQGKYGSTSELHALLLKYIWGPGVNVAIILVLYTYRRWWTWVHGILLSLASITTIVLTLPILMTTGIVYPDSDFPTNHNKQTLYNHYSIGITCMVLMVIVSAGGLINRISYMTSLGPKTIIAIKWGHRISGYILVILCKTNYYLMLKPEHLNLIIVFDAVLGFFFLLRRFLFPKMGHHFISPKYKQDIEKVRSVKDLDQSKSYITFANYIYRGQALQSNHPGGNQVIKAITNKQVDRFLYGAYTADQMPETPRRNHSWKSVSLLGKPIARLEIPQLFEGFGQPEVECKVVQLTEVMKGTNIYQLWLAKKKGQPFQFKKYRDLSQLGRYHTVTLNNKVTRLYSTVSFVHEENLRFLRKYSPIKNIKGLDVDKENGLSINDISIKESLLTQDDRGKVDHCQLLSLMFRVYPQGQFTNGISTQPVKKLMISEEKGEGLQLKHTQPGRIIMVAGGTGQFAFSDLIDLLYKDQLRKEKPECQEAVLNMSPALDQNPFDGFQFQLVLGVRKLGDVHPLTLEQLLFLGESKRIKVIFRVDEEPVGHQIRPEVVHFTSSSYEILLEEEIKLGSVSKIWISGPPIMNQIISSFLRKKYHRTDLYHLV